ncbi:restriction endonuclease subunit S, partial [Flavobacterium filum]|uniref:restriction endonuclease subunit S n=1 Tax=Flavobacterium filum TaxID=370974 RepID=UPI0023F1A826
MEYTNVYLKLIPFSALGYWDYATHFKKVKYRTLFLEIHLKAVLTHKKKFITIVDNEEFLRCRVKLRGQGIELRDKVKGSEIKTKKQQLCKSDDFLVAEIDAKFGGFGIVPKHLENAIVSSHYFLYEINQRKLNPEYLAILLRTTYFQEQVNATGSTNYSAIRPYHVLAYKIPLPSILEQEEILAEYNAKMRESERLKMEIEATKQLFKDYIFDELGLSKPKEYQYTFGLQFINFKDLVTWNFKQFSEEELLKSSKYPVSSIEQNPELAFSVFRGKSPQYQDDTGAIILNQKYKRWNAIELEHAKTVNPKWLASLNKNDFTKEGDILVNSTGEGTIGRATSITKEHEGLMYDSHMLLLRLNNERVNPEFFTYIFNSLYGQQQVDSIKSAQSTKQT